MRITSSVFINDDEWGLHADCEDWLEESAPCEPIGRYRHNPTGEDNGDAHSEVVLLAVAPPIVRSVTRLRWTPVARNP